MLIFSAIQKKNDKVSAPFIPWGNSPSLDVLINVTTKPHSSAAPKEQVKCRYIEWFNRRFQRGVILTSLRLRALGT